MSASRQPIEKAFEAGEIDRFQADIRIRTPKGEGKWLHDCALTIREDKKGDVTGCMGILQDITERRKADEQRKELIRELEGKNVELERFNYAVSHDLKMPLITIKGFLGMLEKDTDEGNTEQMKADMERIRNAAEKMRKQLDELLELSRVGHLVGTKERLAMGDLTREAVELVTGRISERGVRIGILGDLPYILGDRQQFMNVMQYLIDNAVKFMGDEKEPGIEIGVRYDGDKTVCYVKDNGIGIELCYHEKIFGLFDKLDRAGRTSIFICWGLDF